MDKPNPFSAHGTNEEDEDTISLSDLPMYCDQNIEFWVEDQHTSDDLDQDFEFSSEMMLTSRDSSTPIVFCGKVIHVSPKNIQKFDKKKQKRCCMRPESKKLSISTSKMKSRWYVFMFGFGSSTIPKEMHVRDLRKRQLSVESKSSDSSGYDESESTRSRSRRFIKFLGCGGGGFSTVDDEEAPCKYY